MSELFPIRRAAIISPCGRYRWLLTRQWAPELPWLGFVMLNPSTADAEHDDPTIRRCMGFATDLGYGGIRVANLFPLRATDPDVLLNGPDNPIGPQHEAYIHILELGQTCGMVIVAWGHLAFSMLKMRAIHILAAMREAGIKPHALGLARDGWPRHPLYLPKKARPVPYTKDRLP